MERAENEANLMTLSDALDKLKYPVELSIYTESAWLTTALTKWLPKWRSIEYLSAKNGKIAFYETWEKVGQMLESHTLTVFCQCGHSYREWLMKNAESA